MENALKSLGVSVSERGIFTGSEFFMYIGKCYIHRKLLTLPIIELAIKSATAKSWIFIWLFLSLVVIFSYN